MARRDRRRREAGAFAVSVLVHVVLLVVLARVAIPAMVQPLSTPTPDFQLQLVNAPPTPSAAPVPRASRRSVERTAATPAASRAASVQRSPAPPVRAIQARPRPAPSTAPPAPPSPPSRATASTPAAGATGGAPAAASGGSRWTVEGEDDGQDGVRKFLRATVGCSHEDYVRLSGAERAACDRRMGEEARTIGIPSDKLAGFIAAAEAQERARAARTGPLAQPLTPCQGASNFNTSCITPKPRE